MTIESTMTSDGIRLHGILLEPDERRDDLNIDAIMMVHGSNGNFYASASNDRAEALRREGVPVALFNTRGHDVMAGSGQSGGHKVGNAFELLSETHLDIAAVTDWMAGRGYERICVLGSSLGAVRVVLAQAKNQDPRVASLISCGPLRFSHKYYLGSSMADLHRQYFAEATALVAAGKPDQIMSVEFPNEGAHFSAATYLDRHCSEHYDITVAHTDTITCTMLVITGTEEKHPRVLNCGRDMAALVGDKNPGYVWAHIEGGDHGLHTMDDVFHSTVLSFITAKSPVASG